MNSRLYLFLILLPISIILYYYDNSIYSKNKVFTGKINKKMNREKENYIKNRYYFVNNNIVQYASYIVIDKDEENQTIFQIEAIIEHSYIFISDFGSKENYKCLIKSFQTNEEEIIEIDAIDSVEINLHKENRKLIFPFKLESFKKYSKDPTNFNLYYLVVAVIWKLDYNKSLDLETFSRKLDKLEKNQVLPYSIIRFQIPTIIKAQNPRLPAVSLCATYLYGNIPPEIYNWVDYNIAIGINKILIYDGNLRKKN